MNWFTRPRFGVSDLILIYVGYKIGGVMFG